MTIVVHRKAPPLPFVLQELHGKPVVMVICCWVGDVEEGEKVIRLLREFGSPVADVCLPKPYVAHQAMFDPSFRPAGVTTSRAARSPGSAMKSSTPPLSTRCRRGRGSRRNVSGCGTSGRLWSGGTRVCA